MTWCGQAYDVVADLPTDLEDVVAAASAPEVVVDDLSWLFLCRR